jgi:hypothetical protein
MVASQEELSSMELLSYLVTIIAAFFFFFFQNMCKAYFPIENHTALYITWHWVAIIYLQTSCMHIHTAYSQLSSIQESRILIQWQKFEK